MHMFSMQLCDGGLLKFDCRSGGDETLQTIAQVISEITRGVQHDISTVEGGNSTVFYFPLKPISQSGKSTQSTK